jgi:hypothetical protein
MLRLLGPEVVVDPIIIRAEGVRALRDLEVALLFCLASELIYLV